MSNWWRWKWKWRKKNRFQNGIQSKLGGWWREAVMDISVWNFFVCYTLQRKHMSFIDSGRNTKIRSHNSSQLLKTVQVFTDFHVVRLQPLFSIACSLTFSPLFYRLVCLFHSIYFSFKFNFIYWKFIYLFEFTTLSAISKIHANERWWFNSIFKRNTHTKKGIGFFLVAIRTCVWLVFSKHGL